MLLVIKSKVARFWFVYRVDVHKQTSELKMGIHTNRLIKAIKQVDMDFEFYPTHEGILNCIKLDMQSSNLGENCSVLDVGAGDGRVLKHLTNGKKYAIEKSIPLLGSLDKSIFVVGTEFKDQQLLDKSCDVVFSNPPYSEFVYFAERIILEANARYVYLVLPTRWKDNDRITEAVKARSSKATVIGQFDFLDADRQARVDVDVIRVDLCSKSGSYWSKHMNVDPFSLWFKSHFNIFNDEAPKAAYTEPKTSADILREKVKTELVAGVDLVSVLQQLYDKELSSLITTYKKLESVETYLLQELGANIEQLKEALSLKIKSLKDKYWRELFSNLDKVTNRLCSKSRENMMKLLFEHTHVDFSRANAYAIVQWICKNANDYYDVQIIDLVESMIDKANVQLYKSNLNTFGNERWRYLFTSGELDRFALDYRVIVGLGGLSDGYDNIYGLSKRAHTFLGDLCTVASNLGFDTSKSPANNEHDWHEKGAKKFMYYNHSEAKYVVLFEVRAYYNQNLHIKFNQHFIQTINVQFGKLKGWVKSPKEAVDEMGIDAEIAKSSFTANFQIASPSDILQLTHFTEH